jgi:hypothetical protein
MLLNAWRAKILVLRFSRCEQVTLLGRVFSFQCRKSMPQSCDVTTGLAIAKPCLGGSPIWRGHSTPGARSKLPVHYCEQARIVIGPGAQTVVRRKSLPTLVGRDGAYVASVSRDHYPLRLNFSGLSLP